MSLFCLHDIRMRRTRWWPQMSGSSKYVMANDIMHAKHTVQNKGAVHKYDLCSTGMEWLQTPLEPRGIRKCHLHPNPLRDHLEAWHRPLQQVRIYIFLPVCFHVKQGNCWDSDVAIFRAKKMSIRQLMFRIWWFNSNRWYDWRENMKILLLCQISPYANVVMQSSWSKCEQGQA